eukprot:scaffold110113_cov29-Tisochrysis_lutea.AAC.2
MGSVEEAAAISRKTGPICGCERTPSPPSSAEARASESAARSHALRKTRVARRSFRLAPTDLARPSEVQGVRFSSAPRAPGCSRASPTARRRTPAEATRSAPRAATAASEHLSAPRPLFAPRLHRQSSARRGRADWCGSRGEAPGRSARSLPAATGPPIHGVPRRRP